MLKPFRVLLNEEFFDDFVNYFYCMAEDSDHAKEQALNAYDLAVVISAEECDRSEYPFPIHQD